MTPAAGPVRALAEVIVRIGLNLRRGQKLVIAEPYEIHGVDPGAGPFVEAITTAAMAAGSAGVEVLWGDPGELRRWAENNDARAFVSRVTAHAFRMRSALQSRDALLFLQSGPARAWAGMPADRALHFRELAGEAFGPIAQELMRGGTNWTAAPAPTPEWAEGTYPELPAPARLAALWTDVFAAARIARGTGSVRSGTVFEVRTEVSGAKVENFSGRHGGRPSPPEASATSAAALTSWTSHLASLLVAAAELNRRCVRRMRFEGEGTDLEVTLPAAHRWCTAQMRTREGHPFVANLPTEEVFTAPEKSSARGRLRVAGAVHLAGQSIEGLELEFVRGEVVAARARTGVAAFEAFLASDDGARRLGEIAFLPQASSVPAGRRFGLALLDENAAPHVALGESYPLTSATPADARLNRSRVHLDLPLAAQVTFID